uniref:Putative radical SAM superfamily protein n=1 Tax=viral metagenome TaxID=1070528 RepID=A0A6M3LBL1_9ZZZZ
MAIADQLGYKVELLDNNAFRLPLDAVRQEINSPHDDAVSQIKNEVERLRNELVSVDPTKTGQIIEIQEAIKEKEGQIASGLIRSDHSWDVIGISGLSTQYKYIKQFVPICREKHPDALIVGGGGFITSQPHEMLKWLPDLSIGVIGEAYITWQEVLEHTYDRDWKKVAGLVYRKGKTPVLSKMRPLIPEEDLDEEVPWPAYEFGEVRTYLANSRLPYCAESMAVSCIRLAVLTSYGCPYQCTFCTHLGTTPHCQSQIYNKKVTGKPFRQHSPEYVVNLIQHLRQTYCINFVNFLDENLATNKKWFLEFCDLFADSGLATLMNWGMVVHSRTVDAPLLAKAADVGCKYISFGGETSNKELLKDMGKGQTKEQMAAAVQATQNAGINPIMSFMIGLPGSTVDTVMEDLQFYIDQQIHVAPFFVTPYPSTELYFQFKDRIIEQYLTDEEKEFLANPTVDNFMKSRPVEYKDMRPTQTALKKQLATLTENIKDSALERWVSVLDEATTLSANLTEFDDVTLAGLRALVSTNVVDLSVKWWDMKRLEKMKKRLEARNKKPVGLI